MAKTYKNRLEKKYGDYNSYSELMQKIIERNHRLISGAVVRASNNFFDKENKKITKHEKALVLPELENVIVKAQKINKTQERGKFIADNLRYKLNRKLKDIMTNPDYIRRRGSLAGTMKPIAVDDFKKEIKNVFENYTKVDPTIGIPSNIRNIAVTEIRSAVNVTKHEFITQMQNRNPDCEILKIWIHNRKLSKVPRKAHQELNGLEISFKNNFEYYNKETGNRITTPYPHHETMPAAEVIGCSCEIQYKVKRYSPEKSLYQTMSD